jgi:hypothetical protein
MTPTEWDLLSAFEKALLEELRKLRQSIDKLGEIE